MPVARPPSCSRGIGAPPGSVPQLRLLASLHHLVMSGRLLADRYCYLVDGHVLGDPAALVRFDRPWGPSPDVDLPRLARAANHRARGLRRRAARTVQSRGSTNAALLHLARRTRTVRPHPSGNRACGKRTRHDRSRAGARVAAGSARLRALERAHGRVALAVSPVRRAGGVERAPRRVWPRSAEGGWPGRLAQHGAWLRPPRPGSAHAADRPGRRGAAPRPVQRPRSTGSMGGREWVALSCSGGPLGADHGWAVESEARAVRFPPHDTCRAGGLAVARRACSRRVSSAARSQRG